MKKTEILQNMKVLKQGVNVAKLAELFDCSIGRINELKREPVEGQIYHREDVNIEALYRFAEKYSIDLSNVDFNEYVSVKKAAAEKIEIQVGDKTKNGATIIKIQKLGNTFVYLTDTNEMLTKKDL